MEARIEDTPIDPRVRVATVAAPLAVVVVTALLLHQQGRVWWCKCGSPVPWSFDIWTPHNSQHVFDPYSFTHLLHGVVLAGVLAAPGLAWAPWRRIPVAALAGVAVAFESGWELLENSQFVIQKYREATISLDYYGDSVANSMSDIAMCGFGFLLASRLGWKGALALFVVTELVLLLWIRDSLVINVIMLVWPLEAIKQWQLGIAPPAP